MSWRKSSRLNAMRHGLRPTRQGASDTSPIASRPAHKHWPDFEAAIAQGDAGEWSRALRDAGFDVIGVI